MPVDNSDATPAEIAAAEKAYAAYQNHLQESAPTPTMLDRAKSVGSGALKALGAAGGVARMTGAEVVNSFLPEGNDITRPEDFNRMLAGNAPSVSEYMERGGVPKMGQASDIIPGYAEAGRGGQFTPEKGGMLDPSVRGAIGFAGDVATDPITYLSGGLSAANKTGIPQKLLQALKLQQESGALSTGGKVANAVLNPTELYAGGSAKRNYNKAFNYVDKQFPDKAQTTADILRQNGYVGSASGAADKLAEINKTAGQGIGSALDSATEQGAKVNVPDSLESAWNYAENLKKHGTPEADKIATDIQSRIQQLYDTHPNGIPANQANEIKSQLNNSINFNTLPETQKSVRSVAGGLSKGIDASVGSTNEQTLKNLLEQKSMYSSTSPQVQGKMTQFGNQVAQQRGPLGWTGVDTIMAMGGLGVGAGTGHQAVGLLPVVGKKLMNAATSTEGRTARGYAAQKYFDSSIPKDALLRQLLEKSQGENQ